MMNKLLLKLRRSGSRQAALLVGLATLIGVPLAVTSPVSAAAPTAVTTQAEYSDPWVDAVRYTIEVEGDQPFWMYVAGEDDSISVITSDVLTDGSFSKAEWNGLYLAPVDAEGVTTGATAWVVRGTVSAWDKNPADVVPVFLAFSNSITDPDSTDLRAVDVSVSISPPSLDDYPLPVVASTTASADLMSIEVLYDRPLREEGFTWGNNTYLAHPPVNKFMVTTGSPPEPVNVDTVVIDGSKMTLNLASPLRGEPTMLTFCARRVDDCGYYAGPWNPVGVTAVAGMQGQWVTLPADTTAPQLDGDTAPSLASNGTSLTLTFDETLAAAVPATSAFTVEVNEQAKEVTSVENSGATSVLTLAEPIVEDVTVTISYEAPDSGGLQDATGNLVASFTDEDVDNSSTVAAPTTPTPAAPTTPTSPAISRPRPRPRPTPTTTPPTTVPDSAPSTTPPTTVPSSPSTTTPTNTGAPNETTPTRVNDGNLDELTAAAGAVKAMVGGEEVELNVISAAVETDGAIAPEQRTTEQVTELQEMATDIVTVLDVAAGGSSGLEVVETDTGAEIEGIFADAAVPVEDVLVVENGTFAGLYASRDDQGNPVKIRADIVEMKRGGEVAVIVYGLPAGEEAELVLMSIPYLLDSVQIDESGGFTRYVSLPSSVQSGDHTLVTASDTVTISLGVRVSDPVRELPVTGTQTPLVPALFVLGLGSIMIGITRQRRWWTH